MPAPPGGTQPTDASPLPAPARPVRAVLARVLFVQALALALLARLQCAFTP